MQPEKEALEVPVPKREINFYTTIQELSELYERKNADYGSSVNDTFKKYGLTAYLVRMEDKMNRLRTLNEKQNTLVLDEKIEDSLLDLANYAILAYVDIKGGNE